MNYAKTLGQDSIILCDRGVMDGSAYVSRDDWLTLLKQVGVDEVSVRDQRYDAVYHLVTAADGAESFYSLANNKGRSESLEDAKKQDRRTQEVWGGHPHHVIIDNRNTFEQKMERLISLISMAVGLPSLARKAYKYLVKKPSITELPNVQVFDVEKVVLASTYSQQSLSQCDSDSELIYDETDEALLTGGSSGGKVLYSFIRKRSQNKSHSYGLTTVKQLDNGEIVELKNVITARVYGFLKRTSADPTRHIMLQKRYYFLWNKQSFQLYEHLFEDSTANFSSESNAAAASPPQATTPPASPTKNIDGAKGLTRSKTMSTSTRGLPTKLQSSTSSSILTAMEDGLWTLYCQCQDIPEMPPFISVEREVSTADDAQYSAYNLSRKNQD